MNAIDILDLFAQPAEGEAVQNLFAQLNTLRRPALPNDDEFCFHDWVLVRRKGVELGFSDSEYQAAADRFRWGSGQLLLTQAYFYSGFDDVQPFTGELPFGLSFGDERENVRTTLAKFEPARHSGQSDTWDTGTYRLTVTYKSHGSGIDRVVCRSMPAPILAASVQISPPLARIVAAFGAASRSPEFVALWGELLDAERQRDAIEDGEIDFTQSLGATLAFVGERGNSIFRSITLHCNRDRESSGWQGDMPQNLLFEDSPEVLFRKIIAPPVQQSDSVVTGHAVWHFDDYTLHVLYSNVDNRLLRVKLIAPGTWKCIEEE